MNPLFGRYTGEELVSRAMCNARSHSMFPVHRWVAVMDTFACGSTAAYELCRAHGLDPDEMVGCLTCPVCAATDD